MLFADALFNIFAGVFDVLNDVRQNIAVVLLFLYSIIPNLDAIIRVRMLLCESSMLLFVSICCYAKAPCYYSCPLCCYSKPRCYYLCPYAVMRKLDAIIRVCMLLCQTSMLLFVFRIVFVLIRVFRELDRYGLALVIN